ncbi:hypothetical protein A6J76_004075 [Aggregatibacter aphrophilus]|jgi:hypothetical protein|uniref:hypothetical protein n=1 Tax=Aggregatibacter aphrophilus TaxID=732 RepID=UPI0009F6A851|nr:hypothetical protein [Aggregatibacter aphrophilus]PNL93179.1 hypothetical protein A6J76_004075 [Aggregatibacter aphrophilus]
MNKPSWLSWINFFILSFLLCTYLGFIDPKNWIDNIHSKSGIEVITPIQALEKRVTELQKTVETSNVFWGNEYHNLITKEEFNKYQHLSKSNVDWIVTSIKNLQGIENLSNQVNYWKNEISNIKARHCYDQECQHKKDFELQVARESLLKVQLQLSK